MKTLLLIITMCVALGAKSQDVQKILAEQIVEQCRGTITEEKKTDDTILLVAEIPSFIDEETLKISVSNVTRRYSDVRTISTWRRTENNGIQLILKAVDTYMVVHYRGNQLIIAW